MPPSDPPTRRVFLGDIQGCLEELDLLLERIEFRPGADRLYCVGDVINRGPDSAGVVRRLLELEAVVVAGNHELHFLEILAGRCDPSRQRTLRSLLEAPDRGRLEAWIRALPLLHVEPDLVLVHAAMHPRWTDVEATAARLNEGWSRWVASGEPLEDAELRFALEARHCDPLGRRPERDWPEPPPPFVPWDCHWRGRLVVFGHWARRGLVSTERVRGLDTGCVYGGQLSAWIAEEDRIVQVPARRAWCPT